MRRGLAVAIWLPGVLACRKFAMRANFQTEQVKVDCALMAVQNSAVQYFAPAKLSDGMAEREQGSEDPNGPEPTAEDVLDALEREDEDEDEAE